MKRFSCIAYHRSLIRGQSYYSYIFYWAAVTHVSAVFNPRCRHGSRWLFNFRGPSICQSSASPRLLRLLFLRCRFVPSKFCFGLQSAWSNHLFLHRLLFCHTLPPILQSKSTTSIWVRHILRLSAPAQKILLMPLKTSEPSGASQRFCTRTFRNLTEYTPAPEPRRLSALKPSETSPGICTGPLRNLNRYLHRNLPEPFGTLPGTWCWSCTGSHQSFSGLKTP